MLKQTAYEYNHSSVVHIHGIVRAAQMTSGQARLDSAQSHVWEEHDTLSKYPAELPSPLHCQTKALKDSRVHLSVASVALKRVDEMVWWHQTVDCDWWLFTSQSLF